MKKIKEAITKTADKNLGKSKNNLIKSWIIKKLVELIDTRSKYKNSITEEDKNEYKKCRKARRDKEEWLESICSSVNKYMGKSLSE